MPHPPTPYTAAMPLPHPDLDAIATWLGAREITKARPYLERGDLKQRKQQGNTLHARCQGTDPTPYRVEVTLGRRKIRRADCSCPVGGSGRCKHVATLLLAWLEQPDTFSEIPTLDTTLETLERPALLELVVRMVEREPDLEPLARLAALEQRPDTPSPDEARLLAGELITGAHERRHHLDAWGDEWYGELDTSELERLIATLERRGAAGGVEEAAAGLAGVAEALRERLRSIDDLVDDEGMLQTLLERCERLG